MKKMNCKYMSYIVAFKLSILILDDRLQGHYVKYVVIDD